MAAAEIKQDLDTGEILVRVPAADLNFRGTVDQALQAFTAFRAAQVKMNRDPSNTDVIIAALEDLR